MNIIISVHDNGLVLIDTDGGETVYKFSNPQSTQTELTAFLNAILADIGKDSYHAEVEA